MPAARECVECVRAERAERAEYERRLDQSRRALVVQQAELIAAGERQRRLLKENEQLARQINEQLRRGE